MMTEIIDLPNRMAAVDLADRMVDGINWAGVTDDVRLAVAAQFVARHVIAVADDRGRSNREIWERFRAYMDAAPWD